MSKSDLKDIVVSVATFLFDQKAQNIVVLDINEQSGFADYFIVASVSSFGQLRGVQKNVDDELAVHGIHAKATKRSLQNDESWLLIDCGDFIVHLMTEEARQFYALEKLWFQSPRMDPSLYESK